MRFRVTSVTTEEISSLLREATAKSEDWLNAALGDADFGGCVEQFVLVAVSVDDDQQENERWGKAHDKVGWYTNRLNGERVCYVSSAILLPPSGLIGKSPASGLASLSRAAIARLESRPLRVPNGFDYARCAKAVSTALEAYA